MDAPITFEIRKAWWQTHLARGMAVLALVGFIYLLVQKREKRLKADLDKERSLHERINELRAESLRSQMNPHFIFNSLGSIQYYIQTNKVDEADHYLTVFAELMRDFLDASIENHIRLDKELALLKKYTELERMRFDERFSVRFDIAPQIRAQEVTLPSMLIQPFIENAINHGLRQRETGGEISISFDQLNGGVLCRIADNGIGREQAKKTRKPGHKSRAMQNIRERLDVIGASGLARVHLEINDLHRHERYPGTEVRIHISEIEA